MNVMLIQKSIHKRPIDITNRSSYGHWELDSIDSAGNGGYIISFIKIMKIYNINSITTDNGNEFLQLHKLKSLINSLKFITVSLVYLTKKGKWNGLTNK